MVDPKRLHWEKIMSLEIAAILDPISEHCFKKEIGCNLFTFTTSECELVFENKRDMLLIESAWEGKDKSWGGVFHGPYFQTIKKLTDDCRSRNIPVVYWGKEDPNDMMRFYKIAKLADYVFTTDEGCVDQYITLLKHDKVRCMPFAAQASIHNPLNPVKRLPAVFFAGTYWTGHKKRKEELNYLLSAAVSDLHIYDRNFDVPESDRPDRVFPERFKKYIQGGSVSYEIMDLIYKRYRAMINVNLVNNSPTMFSRRVFEAMACGTPVISSPAFGIDAMFGSKVITARSEEEAKVGIEKLKEDGYWNHVSFLGAREVLSKHTYTHRMVDICEMIGLEWKEGQERLDILTNIYKANNIQEIQESCSKYLKQQTILKNSVL